MSLIAALIFVVLAAIVILFQIALAAGMPWGHLTMGGKFPGRLPTNMRGVAIFSGLLLVVFALIVATRAGLIATNWQSIAAIGIWVVVAYCALGVIANAITPSRWERILWVPIVAIMLICSLIVALS